MKILISCAILVLAGLGPAHAQTAMAPSSREQIRLTFSPVVRQVAPAVVNIYTKRVVHTAASPLFADPFFRRFFGEVPGMTRDRVQSSLGSGVLLRSDGTVVTNHHVIKDADEVTVVLSDRREFEARVVGSDERTDLAVLKIEARGENFPTLVLGDSDKMEVGDLVLAIGNPFGVGQTVTQGIVSALARTNVGVSDYRSFIQTDAAINPGNSGGALVDMEGKLIGINTAIYSKDGGSNGIGFAIPTALVRNVVDSITKGGKVVRPWLGIGGQPVTADLAQALKLARPVGVLINNIHRDSPAAAAGLQNGDVVLAVQGYEVEDSEAMRFRLATLPVGSEARLTVLRGGSERQISVRLLAPPETPPRDRSDLAGRHPFSGATVVNINPALAEEIGISSGLSGVLVLGVKRGSVAHRLGVQPGDIVLRVNEKPVPTVAELKQQLQGERQRWSITVNRNGEVMTQVIGG
ncbi:DegQ family serine endoprotease [Magnetospirillum sp. SS-4]|uniref:DegQ family serine endoprotease n=1 Tax=Magnetospirillum sp. SS-4 TaxID=2681465 RepID=UPI00137CA072|nr:DegQ family serine endoprotease [Magnetospirillum sp. SS-4]CAA7620403.1 Trypsin-like serine protease, typically periplasmic, contain C-terminal PDZ domain [Magnetospirillum sp. SS-4]